MRAVSTAATGKFVRQFVGLDPTVADVALWDVLDAVTHFFPGAMLEGVPRP